MADRPLPLRARRARQHTLTAQEMRLSTKLTCLFCLVLALAACRSAMAEKPIASVRHVDLAPDCSRVIVARDARDYPWLMARTPRISAAAYSDMLARVRAMGYDVAQIRKVPQRWQLQSAVPNDGAPLRLALLRGLQSPLQGLIVVGLQ